MRLGLDFDNTLISYDAIFHRVAREKGLIPAETPQHKTAVRDYLRSIGEEPVWTAMQGEVYGARILDAEPFEGVIETLARLSGHVPMWIVSHKTRWPYLGERHDLHDAARRWLDKYGFCSSGQLHWKEGHTYFELTKEAKVARIQQLECTHYVDDLPEILALLPDSVEKILFAPAGAPQIPADWRLMRAWHELPKLLGYT